MPSPITASGYGYQQVQGNPAAVGKVKGAETKTFCVCERHALVKKGQCQGL